MTFYEKVQELCHTKGFEISNLDKVLNIKICRSTISKWKNGSVPRAATVKAIADYIGVSVNYFSDNPQDSDTEADKNTVDNTDDTNEVIVFHRNGKTEKHYFTKEQMQVLYNLMDYMRSSPEGASQDDND